MSTRRLNHLLLLLLIVTTTAARAQHLTLLQENKPTSIRGMSVVDDKTAWVNSSKGYVGRSTDGGTTWAWQQVRGYETADFRGIEAFSDKEAIIMASGTPALVLKTVNGGATWQLKYKNIDTTYFLDAISFADAKHGFILGDPIGNKFLILETKDGGETWKNAASNPDAAPGQASFAASGTCLRTLSDGKLVIVTGGSRAEVITSLSNGKWQYNKVPICSGESPKGIFSVAINGKYIVAVGGDYQHNKNKDSTACFSDDLGKTWHLATTQPAGYQSCVEYIDDQMLIATGTSGCNISVDNGVTWSKFDDTSFNVCRKAKRGTLILFAGDGGKMAVYRLEYRIK